MSAINAAIALVDSLCEQLQLQHPESHLGLAVNGMQGKISGSACAAKDVAQAPEAGEASEEGHMRISQRML